jgi:tRNA A-37 threonylcarbamoyl transferase component Bud32
MNDSSKPTCPSCGAILEAQAAAGLCPGCLMALHFKTETVLTEASRPAQAPLPPEAIAPHFPQLEVLECLGRGGMGVVYKVRQRSLNRLAALKLLAPERAGDGQFAARFTREAQALASLNHPNIVTIYDFGQAGGFFYLLMEFVDGANLRQLLKARKLSPEEAMAIVPPLCDALQFAHDRGLVHRDIKPENLLLDRAGRVKVADFGIARMLGAEPQEAGAPEAASGSSLAAQATSGLTGDWVVGTPGYCAPEQRTDPRRVDRRADIYSLGVVFYELLTGELPGKSIEPPSRRVRIDVRLDEVVLRALAQQPELRYQQASEVKTLLETIAAAPSGSPQGAFGGGYASQAFEFKSQATLFGLPLLHVCLGNDPRTGRVRVARGIVAIGGVAQGVFAFGGMAMGGIAFGGLGIGVLSFSGASLGLVSWGGVALGLLLAVGGLAAAPIALGGMAAGYLVFGAKGIGFHVMDVMSQSPVAERFFHPWARKMLEEGQWVVTLLVVFVLAVSLGVPLWLRRRQTRMATGKNVANNS